MYDIAIIGGGLSGLISSILLRKSGLDVVLLEKNTYPFHRVCGEYISNEVIPFLEEHDLYPADLAPASIDKLIISSTNGRSFKSDLELGGFGISRYRYDHWLMTQAQQLGVKVMENTTVHAVERTAEGWSLKAGHQQLSCRLVIAAHGKRSKLDQKLNRRFLQEHSPYVGVKYHVQTDFAPDTIALHNFRGGYCGFSKIEGDLYNLCYLTHRDQIKKAGDISTFERQVLHKNPHLRSLWESSDFVFEKPAVINEISFKPKELIHEGILMAGDSAGMITPLAGNGMAMAIRSAAILSNIIATHHHNGKFDLEKIYAAYELTWKQTFETKLWKGRQIQKIFFSHPISSSVAVFTGKFFSNITQSIIRQTHGEPFSTATAM